MEEITARSLLPADSAEDAVIGKYAYDEELAKIFCMYIVDGKTQKDALHESGLSQHVYYRWKFRVPEFAQMVKLAMEERSWAHQEQILEIADDATDDAIMGAAGPVVNGKAIRRADLMIQTRKWIMGKMMPKVFGDKSQMELTGADGKDLAPTAINIMAVPAGHFISEETAMKQNQDAAEAGTLREE